LYINRKLIFFAGMVIIFFFLIVLLSKQVTLNKVKFKNSINNFSNVDILEPKFAINNETKKIYITAREGNFLNKDEILLKDNVRFKSNDFSIETESVIFNRDKQTAQSQTKSLFKSENTTIFSNGFDINDNGNKIIFFGNSHITLK
tara:strand:+ start:731 stop:1168 length:438 start_codon:yes stop_codon:yes gene_type:complete